MHSYCQPIAEIYSQNSNSENAFWMKKYLKEQFEFFGIKTNDRTSLNREFFAGYGLPAYSELNDITDDLMNQSQREFHYFAISLASKMKNHWREDTWKLLEKMILSNSWWDTVDSLASNSCGHYFKMFPHLSKSVAGKWNRLDNMWLIRSSILFQLQYKHGTDHEVLFSHIIPHLESKEFFIQKAIGWALRQYAQTNPQAVVDFTETYRLPALSRREALKHVKA